MRRSDQTSRGQTSQQRHHQPHAPRISNAKPHIDRKTTPAKLFAPKESPTSRGKGVYGGNFPKAKRLAFARSGGKCQLCGLRRAVEGHHWAWPNYPPEDEVQGHDLTALCNPCHEFATVLRDWVERKGADFDLLAGDLSVATSFFEKREIFSYWLFPETEEKQSYTFHGDTQARREPVNYKAKNYVSPNKKSQSNCLSWIIVPPVLAVLYTILKEFLGL